VAATAAKPGFAWRFVDPAGEGASPAATPMADSRPTELGLECPGQRRRKDFRAVSNGGREAEGGGLLMRLLAYRVVFSFPEIRQIRGRFGHQKRATVHRITARARQFGANSGAITRDDKSRSPPTLLALPHRRQN